MATSKTNLSVYNKQSAKTKPTNKKPKTSHRISTNWLRKILRFPQAKGKIIESVEFSTELGYHSISVNFTDKTSLNFEIEARFLVETDYSNWKTGNQRIIHRWRPVQNLEFRDTLQGDPPIARSAEGATAALFPSRCWSVTCEKSDDCSHFRP